MRVEVRELRAFVAVAEEGGLSAAARRLYVSQSALSQTVKSLERQLGVQLLLRSSTGVTTTEAGAILLREARALIAQHERALVAVAGAAAVNPGVLRVGIPLEFPADLLPTVLADLSSTYPLTRVTVSHASSAAQLAALQDGELDVALVRECPADPRYDAVLAVEEAIGVILATARADELADPAVSGCAGWPAWSGLASRARRRPFGMTRSPLLCVPMAFPWITSQPGSIPLSPKSTLPR